MKYVNIDDINITKEFIYKLDIRLSGDEIYQRFKLLDDTNHINKKTHTNRIMYPDYEITGIEFGTQEIDNTHGYFESPNILNIKINNLEYNTLSYKDIKNWFEESNLVIPNTLKKFKKESFVKSVYLHSENDYFVIDYTKVNKFALGYKYNYNNIKSRIYEDDKCIMISFEDKITNKQSKNFINNIIENNIIFKSNQKIKK